jgi:hypothetical protein
MHLRDEVVGSEGTIWLNNFLRTGFEMLSIGQSNNYVAEKAESSSGWLFPVGYEVNELSCYHMFIDMFEFIEKKTRAIRNFLRWPHGKLHYPTRLAARQNPASGNLRNWTTGVVARM